MRDNWVPANGLDYAKYLTDIREARKRMKALEKQNKRKRQSLTKLQREIILEKTDGRCHICGGVIKGPWEADHVLSHSMGGEHSTENYLAAHRTCNNYRWDYLPDEFQEIMKLGIWLRTQIEKQTKTGKDVAERFVKYETNRIKRRKQV